MVTKKFLILVLLGLVAVGMVGVLLVLAASAAPAAPLATPQLDADDVRVTSEGVQIAIENARWARVAGTKSMEPVLMDGAHVLERVPLTASELAVGDIITYDSLSNGVTIVHRIVEIGSDNYGWYAITKGDNLNSVDDEKVRFQMVRGVVVAILY